MERGKNENVVEVNALEMQLILLLFRAILLTEIQCIRQRFWRSQMSWPWITLLSVHCLNNQSQV